MVNLKKIPLEKKMKKLNNTIVLMIPNKTKKKKKKKEKEKVYLYIYIYNQQNYYFYSKLNK